MLSVFIAGLLAVSATAAAVDYANVNLCESATQFWLPNIATKSDFPTDLDLSSRLLGTLRPR